MFDRRAYMKEYRETHKKEIGEWEVGYREKRNENSKRSHYKHREERRIQARERSYRNGVKPMNENRECSSFLGVHIAEKVLSKVFKNVERIPINNKGFDFICNKGYQIDVKSSCTRNGKWNNKWIFNINKNKIADYFLCLAFNNRDELKPLYMWLLPADFVSSKFNVTISESTLNKWIDYELEIDKVISCCNTLRGAV